MMITELLPTGAKNLMSSVRVLPLEGGRNFRDLGGYLTNDGRQVRWGMLYRSGSMARLTENDHAYLAKLGIKTVCDFRTTEEREAEPNLWQQLAKLDYWARDYSHSSGELGNVMKSGEVSPEQAQAMMIGVYQRLPFEQALSYRELFCRLAAGNLPLVFNCSAGKDRAGTAAALVLNALGVQRETIIEDYGLSDRVDFRRLFAASASRTNRALVSLHPEVVTAIFNSDPAYLHAAFAAIESKHGSVDLYLREELGVTADNLLSIRQRLLE
jgi:protein-tyrosine phosphatase